MVVWFNITSCIDILSQIMDWIQSRQSEWWFKIIQRLCSSFIGISSALRVFQGYFKSDLTSFKIVSKIVFMHFLGVFESLFLHGAHCSLLSTRRACFICSRLHLLWLFVSIQVSFLLVQILLINHDLSLLTW